MRREFSKEYKKDTVSLVVEQGYTRVEAARNLGIHPTLIGRWVKEYQADEGDAFRGRGKLKAEQEEIRQFIVSGPDQAYVSDITYINTREGWLYLAVVIDLFSRKLVGWSMSSRMKAALVCDALKMAIWQRKPKRGLIVHSDRGSQYASPFSLPKNHMLMTKDFKRLI